MSLTRVSCCAGCEVRVFASRVTGMRPLVGLKIDGNTVKIEDTVHMLAQDARALAAMLNNAADELERSEKE